tara:strand:- start:465 stop:845 length:381 start_codon:yes stop_codon:yes gene_type:complete
MFSKNTELYEEYAEYISLDDVRDAFHILIGGASTLPEFSCHPEAKGEIKDFRYLTVDKKQPFAFIINKQSLLFYLREPAIASKKYNMEELKTTFEEVNENPKGEWTIRVINREDAININEQVLFAW